MPLVLVQTGHPDHTAYVWFMEGAAVYKLPNPWLLCSRLQAKGKQRLARDSWGHWAAQLGKFGRKEQSNLDQDVDWQTLETTFKIEKKKKVTMTAVSFPSSFCPLQLLLNRLVVEPRRWEQQWIQKEHMFWGVKGEGGQTRKCQLPGKKLVTLPSSSLGKGYLGTDDDYSDNFHKELHQQIL